MHSSSPLPASPSPPALALLCSALHSPSRSGSLTHDSGHSQRRSTVRASLPTATSSPVRAAGRSGARPFVCCFCLFRRHGRALFLLRNHRSLRKRTRSRSAECAGRLRTHPEGTGVHAGTRVRAVQKRDLASGGAGDFSGGRSELSFGLPRAKCCHGEKHRKRSLLCPSGVIHQCKRRKD